jgi:hypothetical protein
MSLVGSAGEMFEVENYICMCFVGKSNADHIFNKSQDSALFGLNSLSLSLWVS